MKILFNISHPAHVHLFKYAIREVQSAGHETKVLSRHRGVITGLLDNYGIEHEPISKRKGSTRALVTEMAVRECRAIKSCLSFRPDVVVSRLDMTAIHAAQVTGAESIIFHDTEVSSNIARANMPFIDQIHTPSGLGVDFGEKHQRYDSYQELAYLHPNRFSPNTDQLLSEGVNVDERYFVLRFVGWDAHHDRNHAGLSSRMKHMIVDYLENIGDVFITSESELPASLERYRFELPAHLIHDLMSFADLFIGDSQAMAAEAATLGTPAIRSNSFCGNDDMSKFIELGEEYGLLRSFQDEDRAFEELKNLSTDPSIKETWKNRKKSMLEDKIDLTAYILENIYDLQQN